MPSRVTTGGTPVALSHDLSSRGAPSEPVEEEVSKHLREPGYFAPTPEWDKERSWDRLWS